MGDGDDDAAAEADALDVAGTDELVSGRPGDTKEGGGLLDGERQRLDRVIDGSKDRHGY